MVRGRDYGDQIRVNAFELMVRGGIMVTKLDMVVVLELMLNESESRWGMVVIVAVESLVTKT